MPRGTRLVVMALVLVASSAHGQSGSAPIKGYELYSWKQNDHWHYSLLPGTNRAKTYDEITAKSVVRVGTSVLEAELKRLPRGAEVMWESDGPPGIKRPASGQVISFKHPSRKRIQRIKTLCDKLGIKLTLV